MKNPFVQFLNNCDDCIIIDGGLATELENRGFDTSGDLWSADALLSEKGCNLIESIHYDYFISGADIGTSASYQASFEGFSSMYPELSHSQIEQLMRKSVKLCQKARDRFWNEYTHQYPQCTQCSERDPPNQGYYRRRPIVAASLGCYGAMLSDGSEYRGDYLDHNNENSMDHKIAQFHLQRAQCLSQENPDILAFETFPALHEGKIVLNILEDYPDLPPSFISFSCADEYYTNHGELFSDCVSRLTNMNTLNSQDNSSSLNSHYRESDSISSFTSPIIGIGVNCTKPSLVPSLIQSAVPIIRDLSTPPDLSRISRDKNDIQSPPILIAYPNLGESWNAQQGCWESGESTSIDWKETAAHIRDSGAQAIGGCCRTTPQVIETISQSLRPYTIQLEK